MKSCFQIIKDRLGLFMTQGDPFFSHITKWENAAEHLVDSAGSFDERPTQIKVECALLERDSVEKLAKG